MSLLFTESLVCRVDRIRGQEMCYREFVVGKYLNHTTRPTRCHKPVLNLHAEVQLAGRTRHRLKKILMAHVFFSCMETLSISSSVINFLLSWCSRDRFAPPEGAVLLRNKSSLKLWDEWYLSPQTIQ